MYCLLDHRWSIRNKILVYETILKPVWTCVDVQDIIPEYITRVPHHRVYYVNNQTKECNVYKTSTTNIAHKNKLVEGFDINSSTWRLNMTKRLPKKWNETWNNRIRDMIPTRRLHFLTVNLVLWWLYDFLLN